MKAAAVQVRLRLLCGEEIAIGPGKASLLEAIAETGSISAAASVMGMSYTRAWKLVRTMNACFSTPLVEAARGGRQGGSAAVTPTGRQVASLYRRVERASLKAASTDLQKLRILLRK